MEFLSVSSPTRTLHPFWGNFRVGDHYVRNYTQATDYVRRSRLPACFMIVKCLWVSDLGNTAMVRCAPSYCTTGFVTTATGTR